MAVSLMGLLIKEKLPEAEEMAEKGMVKGHEPAGPVSTSTDPAQGHGTIKSPGRSHNVDTRRCSSWERGG